MTAEQRLRAVTDLGFTECQARFLVTVMLHSGVCVPRQYARFAGTAYGHNVTKFFYKLTERGYATASDCLHNRAALYHVHHQALYRAIGQAQSRYRRPVSARQTIDRVRLLDGVITNPELVWLPTEEEKVAFFNLMAPSLPPERLPHITVGKTSADRLIGARETCSRQGEMLRIQNRHVDWEKHQIAIPGKHAKDRENRRIPFDPEGRLAPILKRRKSLGPSAFVFGSPAGEYAESFKTAWESLLLVANGHDTKRAKHGARVDREKLRQIDLHWHDLRHEGACRLLSDGVDIRTIQLMLGHADIKQTQRYLNITDEELRKAMTGVWERRRQLRAVGQ